MYNNAYVIGIEYETKQKKTKCLLFLAFDVTELHQAPVNLFILLYYLEWKIVYYYYYDARQKILLVFMFKQTCIYL